MSSGSADTVSAASSIHQLSNTLKKSDLNVSLMGMSNIKGQKTTLIYIRLYILRSSANKIYEVYIYV